MAAPEESEDVGSFRDLLTYIQGALASDDVDAVDLEDRLQAAQPQFLTLLQHRVRAHELRSSSQRNRLSQAGAPMFSRLLGASMCHHYDANRANLRKHGRIDIPRLPSAKYQCPTPRDSLGLRSSLTAS